MIHNVVRHAVFLVIDDEENDARKCFDILRPFLREQHIEIAADRFAISTEDGCKKLESEKGCDVVLLDIKGVDEDGTAIELLHGVNPYVPIVMMSNQFRQEKVLHYLALGARTFIWKVHVAPSGKGAESKWIFLQDDSTRRIENLRTIAWRLRLIIDEYQPIKNILNRVIESGGIVKKQEPRSRELENRIEYLKQLSLNTRLKGVFPNVLTSVPENDRIMYEIPYYDLKTLRAVVLNGGEQEHCQQIVQEAVSKVLAFMISEMYLDIRNRPDDFSRIKEIGTNRVIARLTEARNFKVPPDVPKPRWDLLEQLLQETDVVGTDDRSFKHPSRIIKELDRDAEFVERMTPPWLSRIHGDLHFNNIMIDDRLLKAVRFRLIDPKGIMTWNQLGVSDPAYDFGKMFQSTSGFYDLIDVGYLRPDFDKGGLPPLVAREWVDFELLGGRSGAKVTTRSQKFPPWTKVVFQETATFIEKVIGQHKEYVSEDPDWLVRARFYEAAHMLSATPIHLPDISLATAVFIRGVELLNTFYERFRSGGFPKPDKTLPK